MADTVANLHTRLAYRLGESSAPSDSTEKNKRLSWYAEGYRDLSGRQYWWFNIQKTTTATIANQKGYTLPTDLRQPIELRIDGFLYEPVEYDEVYIKYESPTTIVTLPQFRKANKYYILGGKYYVIPTPDAAPTADSVTSITRSGTTATVTRTNHGYETEDYVTIAGANQSAYNVKAQITVLTANTFTYTVSGSPDTPATGTITSTKDNISLWYFYIPTAPTGDSSTFVIPDQYLDVLVAYAEGRYWSSIAQRGKASDAFGEYEQILQEMVKENNRRKMGTLARNLNMDQVIV